jgi:hypothetical protein
VYPLINSKVISKVARLFSIVSFVFAIFAAIVTFYLLQIASSSAPLNYDILVILSTIVPYLFIGVLSAVIMYIAGNVVEETSAEEMHSAKPETAEP